MSQPGQALERGTYDTSQLRSDSSPGQESKAQEDRPDFYYTLDVASSRCSFLMMLIMIEQ
jgi:hypothetical protein